MSFTQEVFRSSSEAGVLDVCINVPNDFQYERPVIYQFQVLSGGTTGQTLQLDVTGFGMGIIGKFWWGGKTFAMLLAMQTAIEGSNTGPNKSA